MTIETQADLDGLRAIGRIVATTLQRMLAQVKPGITTAELDAMGGRWLAEAGAESAPKACYGFPGFTCISVNEEAAHGVPGSRVIAAGDVVNIDVSASLNAYFGDTGGTVLAEPVPTARQVHRRVVHAAQEALHAAMREARHGAKLNRIGHAIERVAKQHRLRVIENLCSHGVGRSLHEEPEAIPGYFDPHDTRVLREGMVITIEPFLSTKSRWADEGPDGWTLSGAPGNRSAQFEHTMVITRGAPLVMTAV
jgi:methionyl aminopeptidase